MTNHHIQGFIERKPDLLSVTKPARYIGRELHSVKAGFREYDLEIALLFPDIYEIGMSNSGLKILYALFNALPGVIAERAFLPWPDMASLLRKKNIPLFTLERKKPVRDCSVAGISLQTELNYIGVPGLLDLARIPLWTVDRTESDPLVIGGGGSLSNPEPVAPFFDALLIGEAEEVVPELVSVLRDSRGMKRSDRWTALAGIRGMYVPTLYRTSYRTSGQLEKTVSENRQAPVPILRRWVSSLDDAFCPTRTIVPYIGIVHDRASLEIARGCSRGCRFCQAGMFYRPHRERSSEKIQSLARELIDQTGFEELALLSLSSTDHSGIEDLVRRLSEAFQPRRVNLSLPSLRMDCFSLQLAQQLQRVRKSGLTFAPEAGSERLRRIINKDLSDQDILTTIEQVFTSSWRRLKLYFMIGLPGEREDDLAAIVHLLKEAQVMGKKFAGRKGIEIQASLSGFVPKAHTPFQWAAQASPENLDHKVTEIRSRLKGERKSIRLSWSDFQMNQVEAVLARGDRSMARVLERVYRQGGCLDGWSDWFSFQRWKTACEEEGLDLEDTTGRERSLDEVFPWDHISLGIDRSFLKTEWLRSANEIPTARCSPQTQCRRCGVCER